MTPETDAHHLVAWKQSGYLCIFYKILERIYPICPCCADICRATRLTSPETCRHARHSPEMACFCPDTSDNCIQRPHWPGRYIFSKNLSCCGVQSIQLNPCGIPYITNDILYLFLVLTRIPHTPQIALCVV